VVSYNGNLFIATAANTAGSGNEPGTSGGASDWAGVSPGSSFSWSGSILNAADTSTYYIAPTSGVQFSTVYSETPGVNVLYSPAVCTVRSLSVHAIVQTAGGSDDTTFVVRHNGSDTSMTCSVTVTSGNASCSSTNSFFVSAGDTLEFSVTQTNGSPIIFYSTLLTCN
jgi:hypothetical protein